MCRTESVRLTDNELSVGVSSREKAQSWQRFSIHNALSYSKRWQCCLAQPNGNGSGWWMLRPGCTAQRGRLVLSDVDICKQECTSCILSSASGSQCRRSRMSAVIWSNLCLHCMIRAPAFSTFCSGGRWTALTPCKTLLQQLIWLFAITQGAILGFSSCAVGMTHCTNYHQIW